MKRIIVCCDGTWKDSDGTIQTPSNVTRIARAIKPTATLPDGTEISQVIFYQNGVGTGSTSLYDKYVGGATGEGLAGYMKEAYSFISLNYEDGDEIFILGFSRGAFTARSISSLICAIGLLTSKGLDYFIQIFEDWQFQLKEGWKTPYPDQPWPGHKPPVLEDKYQKMLLHHELTRPNIPIKCVAVWDTVGGLGIPMIALLPQPPSTDFAFVDTKVEKNIEYAFQALALDEHRRSFTPTIWEKPEGQEWPKVLKQTWFPGVHSDVGGSYEDTDLANLTLCWMVSQLDGLIEFEHDYIWKQVRHSIEWHEAQRGKETAGPLSSKIPKLRPWGLGKIHDSMSIFFRLGGSRTRTPCEYRETEKAEQHGTLWFIAQKTFTLWGHHLGLFRPKPMRRLKGTNETIHASVRIRMGKNGLGYNDKGFYDSQALRGWTMCGEISDPDTPVRLEIEGEAGHMKRVKWKKTVKGDDGQECSLTMPEDQMGEFEKKILKLWPEIENGFENVLPGNHKKSMRRAASEPAMNGHSKAVDLAKPNAEKRKSRDRDTWVMTSTHPNGFDLHPGRAGTL